VIRVEKSAMSQQAVAAAKGIVAVIGGLVLGHGLTWGATFLAYLLYEQMRGQEFADRMFLGGLLLGLALVGLLAMGFGEIKDFAVAMTFGVVIGTYSSIYVAGSTTIFLEALTKRLRSA